MLMKETSIHYGCSKLIRITVNLVFSTVIVLPLVGCGTNGDGGPMISSLSTPTGGTEDMASDHASDSIEADPAGQENSVSSASLDATAGLTPDEADFIPPPSKADALPPSEEDPMITMAPTERGMTARLTWDHSSDANVTGYYVYYGKQPSGEPGSCSPYEESQAVEAPPATITGLEPNTPYFFAISAHNESESPCSVEVMVVTPPMKA